MLHIIFQFMFMIIYIGWKHTQIFGNNPNKSELHSWRLKSGNACYHWVQNILSLICYPKIRRLRCTALFACCFVLLWNLVSAIEGGRVRMFKSRVLWRIFGPKRDEVTRKWRWLFNDVLYDLYCSPNTVWIIRSRRMRLLQCLTMNCAPWSEWVS